jgi:hypothetical protein
MCERIPVFSFVSARLASYTPTIAGSTLQNEYWRTGHDISLRNSSHCHPSPVFEIYFWRVILDETQYIDNKKTQHASNTKMPKSMRFKVAMCVHSAHRWCVSGTPFTTLDDLKTLLIFLRHELGSDAAWNALSARMTDAALWQSVLHLWRNARSSLSLPETTNLVLVTSFSSVEKEIYRSVLSHENCELSDLQRACLHPNELSTHCLQRLGADVSHSRPKADKKEQGPHASSFPAMSELMQRLVAQADEDLEEARLEWYIAMNDYADHAAFNCQNGQLACELYTKGFHLSQDTVVSYPHKSALESRQARDFEHLCPG